MLFNYLLLIQFYSSLSNPTSSANSSPNVAISSNTNTLLLLLNRIRIQNGVNSVTIDKKLNQAALEHSKDQAKQGKMTHIGSDKSNVKIRADRAGYKWKNIAENVAYNQKNESEVTIAWLNSPAHKANMLNSKFDNVGFGYFEGYWTEVFGKL